MEARSTLPGRSLGGGETEGYRLNAESAWQLSCVTLKYFRTQCSEQSRENRFASPLHERYDSPTDQNDADRTHHAEHRHIAPHPPPAQSALHLPLFALEERVRLVRVGGLRGQVRREKDQAWSAEVEEDEVAESCEHDDVY